MPSSGFSASSSRQRAATARRFSKYAVWASWRTTRRSGTSDSAASASTAATSSSFRPPWTAANRKPFRPGLAAPAVTITAPSTGSGALESVRMTAGAGHWPQSSTSLSAAVMPRITAAMMRSPEGLPSRPTASRSASGVFPSRRARKQAKA